MQKAIEEKINLLKTADPAEEVKARQDKGSH
jgi:hypothetical protein